MKKKILYFLFSRISGIRPSRISGIRPSRISGIRSSRISGIRQNYLPDIWRPDILPNQYTVQPYKKFIGHQLERFLCYNNVDMDVHMCSRVNASLPSNRPPPLHYRVKVKLLHNPPRNSNKSILFSANSLKTITRNNGRKILKNQTKW